MVRTVGCVRYHRIFDAMNETKMQPSSLRRITALLAAILLAACQSPPTPGPGVSLEALTAADLRHSLIGNTLSRSGGSLWRRWDYAGVHHDDGTMTGRVSWPDGEEIATGVWETSPDGLYCRAWGNRWGAGQRGCFQVSRGDGVLVFHHVSGSRGDAERYVYRLLPGNLHGL
jgi:hypothetical protein